MGISDGESQVILTALISQLVRADFPHYVSGCEAFALGRMGRYVTQFSD